MIKIIKEGKKPIKTKRVYRVTCWNCKCEFEFEAEDCEIISEKRLNGDRRITVKCPCCGESISGQYCDFHHEDRPVEEEEKPYDIMTDNDTWKIHPEYEPIYKRHDEYDYYDVHIDQYDWKKNINWNTTNLPDNVDNYISRINSIDNYKLPDDYKLVRDCSKCPLGPCSGGYDLLKTDGSYTNCKLENFSITDNSIHTAEEFEKIYRDIFEGKINIIKSDKDPK